MSNDESKDDSKDKKKGSSVVLRRKKSKAPEPIKVGRKTKTLTWLPRVILESSTAQVASTAKPQGNAAAMMRRGRSPKSPTRKKRTKKRKSRKGKKRKSRKGTKKRKNK